MKNKRGDVRMKVLMIVTAVLALGLLFVAAEQFIDSSKGDFDSGTYNNTRYFNISQSGLPDNQASNGPIDMTGNVLLYHMDDAGAVTDSSGNGHHGTPFGGATITTDGKLGNAANFDGTGNKISVNLGAINDFSFVHGIIEQILVVLKQLWVDTMLGKLAIIYL